MKRLEAIAAVGDRYGTWPERLVDSLEALGLLKIEHPSLDARQHEQLDTVLFFAGEAWNKPLTARQLLGALDAAGFRIIPK